MLTKIGAQLIILLSLTIMVGAQNSIRELEDSLVAVTEELMMGDSLSNRDLAFERTVDLLSEALSLKGSFDHPFDSLIRTSIVYAPDSSFRIFTGQHFIDEDHYKYYGILQRKDTPKPIILEDWSELSDAPRDETMIATNWYGALYYNMITYQSEKRTYYIAFGFDAYQMFEKRKIAEVIYFDENQEPQFGAPIFMGMDGVQQNRLVLQYGSDVGTNLNFDEDLQMITYDNLIPMKSPYKANQMVLVPDGSYCGYTLEDTSWVFVEKIFHETLEVAPREVPVFGGKDKRDLFGRKNNK